MGEAIRILLTEDNPLDAKAIIKELNKWQKTTPVCVEHVGLLSLALEQLQKNKFDIIITDLQLPDSIGIETVKRLIEHAPTIPVVVLTGTYLEEESAIEAIRHGAQDYVLKDKLDGRLLMRVIHYAIERKQAEEIKAALEMKSEFISMVSHELRTPLTVIKEGIGIVQDGAAGALNPEQMRYLDLAKKNIDRLARLINDVLSFQKLDSKQLEIQIAENSINQLLGEIKETFAIMAKEKSLELSVDFEEGLSHIYFDRDMITQVLTNLVDNAIKAMEKGRITLKTRRFENSVRVSVEDQGPGIKKEDFPRLFKPFSQLTAGNERKPGSTGLGLAICKRIIDMHGGEIGVESVYGKGASFYFTIPRSLRSLRKKLGEILVEGGLISKEQIEEALKKQKDLADGTME